MKLEIMFFILLQKLFSLSRKSNFSILDIQISWRHQMSMHKTRNTFYWITWEVSGQFMSYYKRKKITKLFCKNCDLKTSSRPCCDSKILTTTATGKWNLWSELLILEWNSKTIKICQDQLTYSFLQRILWKLKRAWN